MNKITIIYILLFISICYFPLNAVGQNKISSNTGFTAMVNSYLNFTVPLMSVEELKAVQNELVILDAREYKEFEVSHISGARHIGFDKIDYTVLKGIDKKVKIVVYCSIGYRSEKVGEKLIAMGFKNVYNLYGSIFDWVNKDNKVVDHQGQVTYNIHGYNAKWSKWIVNKKFKKIY